jgi:hypothetical protein
MNWTGSDFLHWTSFFLWSILGQEEETFLHELSEL